MHKIYSLPLFATSFVCFVCALFVFHRNRLSRINRLFSYLSFAVSLWCFGYGMVNVSSTSEQSLIWARVAFVGVAFIPTFTYHFVTAFLKLERKRMVAAFYAASVLFLFVIP